MLRFLDLFRSAPDTLTLPELPAWLEAQHPSLPFTELEGTLHALSEAVTRLEEAPIPPDSDPRLVQLVRGNRQAYVLAVRQLVQKIALPHEATSASCHAFAEETEETLTRFGKKTAKSFHITQQLIGSELREVVALLHRIHATLKMLRDRLPTLSAFEEASALYQSLTDTEAHMQWDTTRAALEQEHAALTEEITRLEKETAGHQRRQLAADANRLQHDLDQISRDFRARFLLLERPLRKYNNLHPIPLVTAYLTDCVDALLRDTDLLLVSYLQELQTMLEQQALPLKESHRTTSLEQIRLLTHESLYAFKAQHLRLQQALRSAREALTNDPTEGALSSLGMQRRHKEKEMHDLLQRKPDTEASLAELEQALALLAGREVKLRVD